MEQNNNYSNIIRIAITGSPGSGKSQVLKFFKNCGAAIIDFDYLAKKAVEPDTKALNEIIEHFGKKILLEDKSLNRKLMRSIIVNDKKKRKLLESIVHPEVFRLYYKQLEEFIKQNINIVIAEVPLLFEAGLESHFDKIIVVNIDQKLQIKRLTKRDDISINDAISLINTQIPLNKKIEKADFVINNDLSIEYLKDNIQNLYNKLLSK